MNVQQLIDELQKIEDKSMTVNYDDSEYGPNEIISVGLAPVKRLVQYANMFRQVTNIEVVLK